MRSDQFLIVNFLKTSRTRANFLPMMKNDNRISSCWMREEFFHFAWNEDGRLYRIQSLYEEGKFLNYRIVEVAAYFNSVFDQSSSHEGT